jgi:hypothetical protein
MGEWERGGMGEWEMQGRAKGNLLRRTRGPSHFDEFRVVDDPEDVAACGE